MNDDIPSFNSEEFFSALQDMPNDMGLMIDSRFDDHSWRCLKLGPEEMAKLNDDVGLLHIVCMEQRDFLQGYMAHLENNYFTPHTSLNDEYRIGWYRWVDMHWRFCTVPLHRIDWCREAAAKNGLRLADGIPHCLSNGGEHSQISVREVPGVAGVTVSRFPLNSPRTFVLEPDYGEDKSIKIGGIGVVTPAPVYSHERTYIDDILDKMRRKK